MGSRLRDMLRESLDKEELGHLVGSYDVVGDIAITIIPDQLNHREKLIGEAILSANTKIKVVAKRAGNYQGEYRVLPLQIIAGEEREETVVREFGISYHLNPGLVYFSVRSGSERKRVASLVKEGEKVLVMFSGIGPYPLVISKCSKASRIIGIEKNPIAHRFGIKNLQSNRKLQNIELFCGDVRDLLDDIAIKYDRIIMPLPKGGELYLDCGLAALEPGGVVHFYHMQQLGHFDESIKLLSRACGRANRGISSLNITKCGHCAPKTYRICLDAQTEIFTGK